MVVWDGQKVLQIAVLGIVWGCLRWGRLRFLGTTRLGLVRAQIISARPSSARLVSGLARPRSDLNWARPDSALFGLVSSSSILLSLACFGLVSPGSERLGLVRSKTVWRRPELFLLPFPDKPALMGHSHLFVHSMICILLAYINSLIKPLTLLFHNIET